MLHAWKNGISFTEMPGEASFGRFGDISMPNLVAMGKADADYFTDYYSFSTSPSRIRGQYRLRTAEALLDTKNNGGKWGVEYILQLKFVDIQDGVELYNLIRAGEIWPEISFEKPQLPSPLCHLKDLWRGTWRIIWRGIAARFHRSRS